MKGPQITVFALDMENQLRFKLPDIASSATVHPLLNYVDIISTADAWIQSLLKQYLSRVILVKDLDQAFRLSEEH